MNRKQWKKEIGDLLFTTNTPLSKAFDIVLLILILLSILLVMLESVESYTQLYQKRFFVGEYIITWLFTIEYVLRLRSARSRKKYAFSFYGLVDLISILPAYIWVFLTWASTFAVVRGLRLLRIFRILKLNRYVSESNLMIKALQASSRKIFVFLIAVTIIVIIAWSVMYLVEGWKNGFENIPMSIYRAVVTITTVWYGDITPVSPIWQFLAWLLMIVWYWIIAVPTGIVTSEMTLRWAAKEK